MLMIDVTIFEVGPRDGLQNEAVFIDTATKIDLVNMLSKTGLRKIETTSFVSPKWVPQLGDAAEVIAGAAAFKTERVQYSALVPNEQGLARAFGVHEQVDAIDKISVFTAASETFTKKNTNATVDETLDRFRPVIDNARRAGLVVRGYVSCAIACPYEGEVAPEAVARVAARLLALGVDEIDLGDTIGAGTPDSIEQLVQTMYDRLGPCRETDIGEPCLTLHLHDTNGQAIACAVRALELGVRSFDSAVGGLGGCPYATVGDKRAPGNVATESLVDAIEAAGYQTGVDRKALARAAAVAASLPVAGVAS